MAQAQAPPPDCKNFNPVDTSNLFSVKDEVESPGLSNPTTRARFEFESGRGNDGTKILMVEWEDDDTTRAQRGDWQISWEGKNTVLPAGEKSGNDVNRIYFLLPPGIAVPTHVTLTHRPADSTQTPVVWRTNSLPAIYPPELGASARTAGKKGVLHTLWAKKRLQELQREIDAETKHNLESVGLEMATQEKEWIEQNFGVSSKPISLSIPGSDVSATPPQSPTSPRSPGGGRLAEKLKGLKLGTSTPELTSRQPLGSNPPQSQNPLSPDGSDVAFSSFAAIKGANPAALAAKPPQAPQGLLSAPGQRRIAAQGPPASILSQQQGMSMGSLNAFAGGMVPTREEETEDDLFALPMSPRSPEMSKSPFSFAATDTGKYVQGERAA